MAKVVNEQYKSFIKSNIVACALTEIWPFNIDSLLIVRNDYMVFDAYFYPFSNEQKHHMYSCTKSIMSAWIGIAIDKGYIQNVNQPITDFFPDKALANADDLKKSITVENLLTMASGLNCGGWAGFFDMWNSDDWEMNYGTLSMPRKVTCLIWVFAKYWEKAYALCNWAFNGLLKVLFGVYWQILIQHYWQ